MQGRRCSLLLEGNHLYCCAAWEKFSQSEEGAALPDLQEPQAGGEAAAKARPAALRPTGRRWSGAGLLRAAGRRAGAQQETREEQINSQIVELPQMTRLLGVDAPPTRYRLFYSATGRVEKTGRAFPAPLALGAASDSASPHGCLPLRAPQARTANPAKTNPSVPARGEHGIPALPQHPEPCWMAWA